MHFLPAPSDWRVGPDLRADREHPRILTGRPEVGPYLQATKSVADSKRP
jgi:hypothetical protein